MSIKKRLFKYISTQKDVISLKKRPLLVPFRALNQGQEAQDGGFPRTQYFTKRSSPLLKPSSSLRPKRRKIL